MVENPLLCRFGKQLNDAACGAVILKNGDQPIAALTTYHDGMQLVVGFSGNMKRSGLKKLSKKVLKAPKDRSCPQGDADEIADILATDDEPHPVIITQDGKPKYYLFPISQFNFLEFAFWYETHWLHFLHAFRLLGVNASAAQDSIGTYEERAIQARSCELDLFSQRLDLAEANELQRGCMKTFFADIEEGRARAWGVDWRGSGLFQFCDTIYLGRETEKALELASGRECLFC